MRERGNTSNRSDLGIIWIRKGSSPERFTPRRKVAGAKQIGGWVGLTDGSDTLEKKKKSPAPARNRTTIPRLPNPQRRGYSDRNVLK